MKKPPWYLIPLVLAAGLLVMIPLGILALLSIPYYSLFPDRRMHIFDLEGAPHQRSRLEYWRALHRRMSLLQRIGRLFRLRRRRRVSSSFPPE